MLEGLRLGFCDACKNRQLLAKIHLRSGRIISLCKYCLSENKQKIIGAENLYKGAV